MKKDNTRGKLVAIITGFISIAIGIIYLGLIAILDARGPMLPPPPEAYGVVAIDSFLIFQLAVQLYSLLSQ